MARRTPEVDGYIAKSAPFARPILKKVRSLFLKASPKMRETIKWGSPSFECEGMIGSMAAFKRHVTFGFWKAKLMSDPNGLFEGSGRSQAADVKVTSLAGLPADRVMLSYIAEAIRLNESGARLPRPRLKAPRRKLVVPAWFMAALRKSRKALATYEAFSPSHKREYVEWVTGAKREATRQRRLATAIEWMAAGKTHNWRYEKKRS